MRLKGNQIRDEDIEAMSSEEFKVLFADFSREELIDFLAEIHKGKAIYRRDKILIEVINNPELAMFTFWAVDQEEARPESNDDKYDYKINLWEGKCRSSYKLNVKQAIGRNYLDCFVHPIERKVSRDSMTRMYEDMESSGSVVKQGPDYNIDYPTNVQTEVHLISTRYLVVDPDSKKPIQVELGLVLPEDLEKVKENRDKFVVSQKHAINNYRDVIKVCADEALEILSFFERDNPTQCNFCIGMRKSINDIKIEVGNTEDLIKLKQIHDIVNEMYAKITRTRSNAAEITLIAKKLKEIEKDAINHLKEILDYDMLSDTHAVRTTRAEQKILAYKSALSTIENYFLNGSTVLNSFDLAVIIAFVRETEENLQSWKKVQLDGTDGPYVIADRITDIFGGKIVCSRKT